jgi:hypothetical protein
LIFFRFSLSIFIIAWWNNAGIDPTVTARTLWLKTDPPHAAPVNIEAAKSTSIIDWAAVVKAT